MEKVYILDVMGARKDKDNIEKYLEEGIIIGIELAPSVCAISIEEGLFEIVPWSYNNFKFIPSRVAVRNLSEASEFINNL